MRGKGKKSGKAGSDVSSGNNTQPPSSSSSSKSGESHLWKTAIFFLCVAAIYASYISQGLLQENICTKKYGKDQQRFQYLAFLNLMQCTVCFVWSFAMLQIWRAQPGSNPPPLKAYCAPAVSNTIGPACGILALRYISYPAQVLAKSSKMVPVMVMGAIMYGVHYTPQQYLCTFLVAGGVSVFALNKSSSSSSKVAIPNAPLGYSLCLINLALDGFTNASQDSITARYPGVNAWHIMMGMNFWGTIYMSLFLFLVPGAGGYAALSFCAFHPDVSWDIFWFSICGAVGQNFIFLTISLFGALTNTTVTTTRKFMSILMSSIWNKNHLSMQQWGGVCMVFGGLSFQIWLSYQKKLQKPAKQIRDTAETQTIDKTHSRSPTSPRARSPMSQRARSSNNHKGQNRNQ